MLRRLVALLLLGVLAACGSEDPPVPSYEPRPDDELYADIADIPGVTDVDIAWVDSFEVGKAYSGTIGVRKRADAVRVLDRAYAILWQGRRSDGMLVTAVPEETGIPVNSSALGLTAWQDFIDRYGSQPGSGEPPAAPLPTR